jgi:hypothetical protein
MPNMFVCRNTGNKMATASHDIGHLARYLSMEWLLDRSKLSLRL